MDYNSFRRKTRSIKVGNVGIGGNYPISIQSMTNTDTHDKAATYNQVLRLQEAGCDIVRLAINDIEAAKTIAYLKDREIKIPLVADIHFDYKIALEAVNAGVDKIRINPGNIGSREKTEKVVRACKDKKIPIRIGVNSGSVEKKLLEKYGRVTPEALSESALSHAKILEELDFSDVLISVKASNVPFMLLANKLLAESTDYPLHLGVTEAGTQRMGLIKSSVGIGSLLTRGIGDTIRVSLTADPVQEIYAGFDILKSIGIDNSTPKLVSCPTCGRTKIDLIGLANEVEERLRGVKKNITVAVMGCVVNGPGEAREADIGIAGGDKSGLIFKKGEILRKVSEDEIIDELMKEIDML
jgi:(E)-4-hydroxy-3-methylbut-2-enyl-diphosphate synthase